MAGYSRRSTLVGATGVVAALSGCSFGSELSGGSGYDDDALRRLAAESRFERPSYHPLAVPDATIRRHRTRARALLDEVPSSPEVPNQLAGRRIEDERERLSEKLTQGNEEQTETEPTEEGTDPGNGDEDTERTARQRARDRLTGARRRRKEAAALWGIYRAATGSLRQQDLVRRRDRQRDRLAAFRRVWAYRASDPVRAALVHEQLEHHVDLVERDLTPWPEFPDDPAADTDAVGYLFEKVEEAAARLDELQHYREQVAREGRRGYRPALMAAATWLRRRARRESFRIETPLEQGLAAFDRDLGESVARYRFTVARDVVRDYSNGDLLDAIEEEGYANAVLFAATRRAAMATLVDAVDTVESGPAEPEVSASSIERLRREARQAVESTLDHGADGLTIRLLAPAFGAMRDARDELQKGADGTPPRAYAGYQYAKQFAVATTDAADELVYLLDEAAD